MVLSHQTTERNRAWVPIERKLKMKKNKNHFFSCGAASILIDKEGKNFKQKFKWFRKK